MVSSLESKSSKHEMNASIAPGVILSTEVDETDTCPVLHSLQSGLMGGGGLEIFMSWKTLNDSSESDLSQELATHYYICLWM